MNIRSIPPVARRLSRRAFMERGALFALGFAGFRALVENRAHAARADSDLEDDFYGIIDLPPGFGYVVISEKGEKMDDGLLVPGKHDGMGAFAGPRGRTILVRNHEVEPQMNDEGPFRSRRSLFRKVPREKLYDPGHGKRPGLGGTTTLVYDTRERRLERHYLSLAGTYRNCAGGVTPWNTWITCEEDVSSPNADGTDPDDPMEREHGYNFEVTPSERIGLVDPVPLRAMGRFRHEAVAVEPRSGVVYQTEDRGDGLFYRFIPSEPGRLAGGGRLQSLRIRDVPRADTRNWRRQSFAAGEKMVVDWVDVENTDAPDDDLRYQGYFEKAAARFGRGEGCWYGNESVYFACTNGGEKRKGQIWRYFPCPAEGAAGEDKDPARLELFIEADAGNLVENADNLTVSPWGDLILCEDGPGSQYLVGITPTGESYHLGRTSLSELAGACFSPDGRTLFVNVLNEGLTLAITGPWERWAHRDSR
jgi:secreted PhoX family phosphatase